MQYRLPLYTGSLLLLLLPCLRLLGRSSSSSSLLPRTVFGMHTRAPVVVLVDWLACVGPQLGGLLAVVVLVHCHSRMHRCCRARCCCLHAPVRMLQLHWRIMQIAEQDHRHGNSDRCTCPVCFECCCYGG